MSTTYENDLRLTEIGNTTEAGNWGTLTNANMQLIGEAWGYGEEAIADSASATITIADGAPDAARSMYLKVTGSLQQACTITMGPNTSSRVMFIENGTSDGGGGPWDIIISQSGMGSTVTIPNGETRMIHMDGAGGSAAVVDALSFVPVSGLSGKITGTQQPNHVYAAAPAAVASSGATLDFNWNDGNCHRITNDGAPTAGVFAVSNPVAGGNYSLVFKSAALALADWGTHWPTTFKWRNNTAPIFSVTLDESAVVVLIYDGANYLASFTVDHPA